MHASVARMLSPVEQGESLPVIVLIIFVERSTKRTLAVEADNTLIIKIPVVSP